MKCLFCGNEVRSKNLFCDMPTCNSCYKIVENLGIKDYSGIGLYELLLKHKWLPLGTEYSIKDLYDIIKDKEIIKERGVITGIKDTGNWTCSKCGRSLLGDHYPRYIAEEDMWVCKDCDNVKTNNTYNKQELKDVLFEVGFIEPSYVGDWDSLVELARKQNWEGIPLTDKQDKILANIDIFTDLVTQEGIKHDQDKDPWDLLPWNAVKQIVKVLAFGAKKYTPNNWQKVDSERYFAACIRHLVAYKDGEKTDPESGLSHLAHAGCCVLFMLWEEQNDL